MLSLSAKKVFLLYYTGHTICEIHSLTKNTSTANIQNKESSSAWTLPSPSSSPPSETGCLLRTTQGTQRYYVVHLVKENTVEVVPEQWVEKRDGVLCCYWPRNASATMIKRGDQPDKILWEKYRISIFSSTDNYSVAEQRAKRGVDTSNVESDEEPAKRVVTKPIRFHVEPPDDDDGSEALQKQTNEPRQVQLPVPQLPPAPSATSRASVFEKTLQVKVAARKKLAKTEHQNQTKSCHPCLMSLWLLRCPLDTLKIFKQWR
eukprot:XP_014046728.1 PREDICTED: uncharacterized protein LOC106599900 isoform X3 [Salmo salar]